MAEVVAQGRQAAAGSRDESGDGAQEATRGVGLELGAESSGQAEAGDSGDAVAARPAVRLSVSFAPQLSREFGWDARALAGPGAAGS